MKSANMHREYIRMVFAVFVFRMQCSSIKINEETKIYQSNCLKVHVCLFTSSTEMFMQRQPLKTLYVHISRSNRYCTGNNLPIVTLFTKDDCSLCDKAVEELKPFKHQFVLEKVDITKPENKEWYKKYRYDIPVFHLNGEFLMKHKSDLKLFQERIAQLEQNANK